MPRRSASYSEEVLLASAARTASGDSGELTGYGAADSMRVQLDVTAVAGTTGPTLDVVIEDTLDGVNWNVIGTFTQRTAVGRQVIDITGLFAERVRARYTIGGSADRSFTFSVVAATQTPGA